MVPDNIEKLKKQIEKDPSSKLFVPLAEEYRKAGRLDEAAEVLQEGLERQPGYMSARVALGKIYLEKRMHDDAIAEFEAVVEAIPGNLLAHRKLADTYREMGLTPAALQHYRKVLELSPMDEDVQGILNELQGKPDAGAEDITVAGPEATAEVEDEAAAEVEDEDEDFIISLSEDEVAEAEGSLPELAEEAALADDADMADAAEGLQELKEDLTELEEAEDLGELEVVEDLVELEEAEDLGELEEADLADAPEEGPGEAVSAAVGAPGEVFQEIGEVEADEGLSGLKTAESYISQGLYAEALNVYEGLLLKEPDDTVVLQRLHELKSLLKLLGKEQEIVVARLSKFLEDIRKRRDEFFGNA